MQFGSKNSGDSNTQVCKAQEHTYLESWEEAVEILLALLLIELRKPHKAKKILRINFDNFWVSKCLKNPCHTFEEKVPKFYL